MGSTVGSYHFCAGVSIAIHTSVTAGIVSSHGDGCDAAASWSLVRVFLGLERFSEKTLYSSLVNAGRVSDSVGIVILGFSARVYGETIFRCRVSHMLRDIRGIRSWISQ